MLQVFDICLLVLYIPESLDFLVFLFLLLPSVVQALNLVHLVSHLISLPEGVVRLNFKFHLQLLHDDGLGGFLLLDFKGFLLLDQAELLLEKLFIASKFVLLHFTVDHLSFLQCLHLILLHPHICFLLLYHHLPILLLGEYLPLQLQPMLHSQILGKGMPLGLFLLEHEGVVLIDLGPFVGFLW